MLRKRPFIGQEIRGYKIKTMSNDILRQVRNLWSGHALLAAKEVGILDLLWNNPAAEDEILEGLNIDPRGGKALLAALNRSRIIMLQDNKYHLSLSGREAADPEGSLSGYLDFHIFLNNSWSSLSRRLLGRTHELCEPNRSDSPQLAKAYIRAMDLLGKPVSKKLARALKINPGDKILDLGGGSSVHAKAILKEEPLSHVTLLDRKVVIDYITTEENRESRGINNLTFLNANYLNFKSEFRYDVVLLSNVIHNECKDNIDKIFHTCFSALRQGGHLAILDYFIADEECTAPHGFELLLYSITQFGKLYKIEDISSIALKYDFSPSGIEKIDNYTLFSLRKN